MHPGVDFNSIHPAFTEPVHDAQSTFRALLEAMSHPTRIVSLNIDLRAPAPLHKAAAAICLTLLDFETQLWTDLDVDAAALGWLRFHCGCPLVSQAGRADFALAIDCHKMLRIEHFHQGLQEYPEKSTTIIAQVRRLAADSGGVFRGPGIERASSLRVDGLPDYFWAAWQKQSMEYPLGVDVILVCGDSIAALPRTTWIEN
jgi:alpha-D-ribose 1-methylphosphonate 5-triphosphate synthase subunit PhnH